jgi:dihydrofolate synthase / folylpolyglutamate synthase
MTSPMPDYLERLNALHPRKIDLSLGRTQALLAKLNHPERRLPPVIHVAGTNGKGSTIAFMRAMLEAAGKAVHVFTSPHLIRFHERIRIGGDLVDDATLEAACTHVEAVNAGEPITFFEITTVIALWLFAEYKADVLLLEVGLGGRFDATNVVDHPAASVITPVSMDHREYLGDTIEKIAFEKAGIIKKGVPAIIAQQDERAIEVLMKEAARHRAPPRIGGQDFTVGEENGRFIYQEEAALIDLPLPRMAGRHQHINAATAIATLRAIWGDRIPQGAIAEGLQTAHWPGRLHRLTGALAKLAPIGAELWLDGAHNADGARVLAEAMGEMETHHPRPLILMCGMMARKDAAEILKPFAGLAQALYALPIVHSGAREAVEIEEKARDLGIPAALAGDIRQTLRFIAAQNWQTPPRILLMGSLYLAGEALEADG